MSSAATVTTAVDAKPACASTSKGACEHKEAKTLSSCDTCSTNASAPKSATEKVKDVAAHAGKVSLIGSGGNRGDDGGALRCGRIDASCIMATYKQHASLPPHAGLLPPLS